MMNIIKGNIKMINTKENSATQNGTEKWGKSKKIGGKKGNQMDVIPYMLRLALLILHPLITSTSKTVDQVKT